MTSVRVGKCLLSNKLSTFGMTQQQLADKMGKSKTQISDYATGRTLMSLTTAKNIANVLGCHADDLYEWVVVED